MSAAISEAGHAAIGMHAQRDTSFHGKLEGPLRKKQPSHCSEGAEAPPPDNQSPTKGKQSPTCEEMAVRGGKVPGPGRTIRTFRAK